MRQKPNWRKIDDTKYQQLTEEYLSCLVRNGGLELPTEVTVERLNDILTKAAEESGGRKLKACKRKSKLPWSNDFKPLVER